MVFLGTSGQNVSDVVQFTNIDSALDALDLIVQARYLAPTAPDTLGSYPFTTLDPFVLQNNNDLNPHVVFAGNQPENAYKLLPNGNLMIATVSNFSIRPEILLVNVNDIKDVRRVRFDVQDSF
jgi:DNA polymerase delta subunit 2